MWVEVHPAEEARHPPAGRSLDGSDEGVADRLLVALPDVDNCISHLPFEHELLVRQELEVIEKAHDRAAEQVRMRRLCTLAIRLAVDLQQFLRELRQRLDLLGLSSGACHRSVRPGCSSGGPSSTKISKE